MSFETFDLLVRSCTNVMTISQFVMTYSLSIVSGLFDQKGKLLGSASSPIQIWKEKDCIEVENCS